VTLSREIIVEQSEPGKERRKKKKKRLGWVLTEVIILLKVVLAEVVFQLF